MSGALPNCDCCGRFMRPMDSGTSWVCVPDSALSSEEIRYRCATCTMKYGKATPNQNVREDMCSGVMP